MDTIYKVFENCEVKKVGERQYEFTASTADMDRDGEVIDVSGWDLKNFKKNPVIMFAHDYKTLPIGRATKIGVRDGKLMNVVEFPPEGTYEFADTVARLVDAGYLKTESVGFIPKKWEDAEFEDEKSGKPHRTYTKQELLEISIVSVPSNPNALMNAVKEGVITQKQFNSITEPAEVKEDYPKPEKTSQESIIDEIDYLKSLIEKEGMNDITLKAIGGLVKYTWGELIKMDMGKMQEMHDMMASAETMAKKSKKMAEDMMAEYDKEDMKRISGYDKPVDIEAPSPEKTGVESSDILESLKRIGGK